MARGARQKAADIRTSLIEQMQAAGSKPMAYIIDLVDGYMDMWRVREKARADISKRGVVLTIVDQRNGMPCERVNPSVQILQNMNKQMSKFIKDYKLDVPVDEDEEL